MLRFLKKWWLPIVLVIVLVFAMRSSTEGFFSCPEGSQLRNGGCYSCEDGYYLNGDYYNAHCLKPDSSDIKPPVIKNLI